MSPAISILQRTIVLLFYRRHAIFFGVLLFFFVGVVRPPQFFFSGQFIGYLLVDPVSLAGVLAIFVVYFLYVLRFLQRIPGEAVLHFLHVLPAMGRSRLQLPVILAVAAVLAPVLIYLGTMVLHGILQGKSAGGLAAILAVAMLLLAQKLLLRRLMRPLAGKGSRFDWKLHLPRNRMPLIYLGVLRRLHRNAVFITKLVSFLLISLLLYSEIKGAVPYALRGMAFLISALLQSYLVIRLRETEKQHLAWFRNLPYSGVQRLWHFTAANLLLNLPEFLLLLLFILREGLSPWLLPHFMLSTTTFWILSIGITYLPQVRSQDFYVLLHSLAVGIFIGLLFQFPIGFMYAPFLFLGVFMVIWGIFRED
ncbi:MAG TPA: hypothetical protein ENJ82_13095 [Bacteroidetes bacterium]|nr:hypothetical protein [Bacteroidota bacterium]